MLGVACVAGQRAAKTQNRHHNTTRSSSAFVPHVMLLYFLGLDQGLCSPRLEVQVGFTMPWAALASELGYLKMLHGPNFLLYLNLAYFLPSAPILLLQLALDQHYNRLFGTAMSTLVRQSFAQIVCATSCFILPFLPWSRRAPALYQCMRCLLLVVLHTRNAAPQHSPHMLPARLPLKKRKL